MICGNAHHLRELTRAADDDKQIWAANMHTLLTEINEAVRDEGGVLSVRLQQDYRERYNQIILAGEAECFLPPPSDKPGCGRVKKSKSRNLLERLCNFKDDVLRFMAVNILPFTNNTPENDIRITKVEKCLIS